MPHFTEKTPTFKRTFAGHDVLVPALFADGAEITADVRTWIDGQLATVIGNAFGGGIRRNGDTIPDGFQDAQDYFNSILYSYDVAPSNRGSGSSKPKSDPVASMARSYAEVDLIAKLEAKGLSVKTFRSTKEADGRTSFTRLLDAQYAKLADEYRARAEEAFAYAADAADGADDDDDDLDYSIPEDAVAVVRKGATAKPA